MTIRNGKNSVEKYFCAGDDILGRKLLLALALSAAAACAPSTLSRADDAPAYSASDIVRHFAAEPSFGAARSLCIGAAADCPGDAAEKAARNEAFDLEVTFELGSDRLTPRARKNLDQFAEALRDPALAARRFHVDGHTDARGRDETNLRLSQRRAEAVRNYLVSAGIDAARLDAQGYGRARPKARDPLDPANRRVETRAED
ncbi:OmpA family protein [Methylosinus sp. PW1]|uniref:OmpA family protein n=1 Tax=Methylosinus sp. PW1 TaxID=107636 RepID=UPI0018DD7328|nr:OmpA family protein [Methylosinus sp. PW1]